MAAWCCDSGCDDVGMVQSLHDVQLLRQDACGIWGYGYVGRRPSVSPCCWRYPCALYNHLNLTTMIFFKQQILKPPTTGTSKNFGREVSKIWHAIHISISQPGLIWKNGNIAWHLVRYTSGIHIYIYLYIYIYIMPLSFETLNNPVRVPHATWGLKLWGILRMVNCWKKSSCLASSLAAWYTWHRKT